MKSNSALPIDPILYLRTPRLGVDSGLSLSKMLIALLPEGSPPGVKVAARALAAAVRELEERSDARMRLRPSINARPADLRLDRAWGAIEARLRTWDHFADGDPDREMAAEIYERLFPTGLDFLTLPFVEEHAQSERRVRMLDDEGRLEDLEALVGDVFVEELMEAHAAYGTALGITAPMDPAVVPAVAEPLRAVLAAISRYALQIIAFADQHPDNVEPARRALAPIDAFRRAARRRQGRELEDEVIANDEDYPLPEGAPAPDAPMAEIPA